MSRSQSQQTNLYNGNISFSSVSIPSGTQPQYFPAPQLAKYRYDQLNRITSAVYTSDLNPSTLMWGGNFDNNWASTYSYDPNGNIKTLTRNQTDANSSPPEMDDLEYHYIPGTNQLEYVADGVAATASNNDIDPQTQGNYSYDLIGNLTKDDAEGISAITWLPNNKIGTITKTNGMVIQFTYDASGQRITKKVEKIVQGVRITEIEFYLRDASGTVMANYILHPDSCTLLLKEQPIYGSSRLGVYAPNKDVTSNTVPSIGAQNAQQLTLIRGQRLYELNNWLGNVQVVITDKKLAICGNAATPAYYEADIQSAQDFYPGGSLMPGRNYNIAGYRYGFNGKEKDDEIKGSGNSLDFGARIYDPRLGRFLSLDPMASHFPDWSPYVYACDNPIALIDENGEFGDDPRGKFYKTMGTSAMKAITAMDVNANKFKALYVLAQYRNENGFNLNSPGNNPFNIKGKGDAGQITYLTTEYIKGKPVKMQQSFASFSSLEAGFSGYLNLLKSNFSNASSALTDNSKTIEDFANGLMNGKMGAYATSPTYAADLKSMLKGVVRDYENDINNQLKQNNTLISKNNEILNSKTATDKEKSAATKSNSDLNSSNQNLNNDLQQLQDFKKNEGLDK